MNHLIQKQSIFAMMVISIFAGFWGCASSSDNDEIKKPGAALDSLDLRIVIDDEAVSPDQRFYYSMIQDADAQKRQYEAAKEGTTHADWLDDVNQRVWWSCESVEKQHIGEGVDPYCRFRADHRACEEVRCEYDLRIHRDGPIEALNEENSWVKKEEDWYFGTFDWSREFGDASTYAERYEDKIPVSLIQQDEFAIEIDIRGEQVDASGWPRRHEFVK